MCEMEEWPDGTIKYYKNGKLHREDGPAIEWYDGTIEWWLNGYLHRTDGPAIERPNGTREWWINGVWQEDKTMSENKCKYQRLRDKYGIEDGETLEQYLDELHDDLKCHWEHDYLLEKRRCEYLTSDEFWNYVNKCNPNVITWMALRDLVLNNNPELLARKTKGNR